MRTTSVSVVSTCLLVGAALADAQLTARSPYENSLGTSNGATFAARGLDEEEVLFRRKNPKPAAKPPAKPNNRPGIGQTYFSGAGTAAIEASGGIMQGVGSIIQATQQPKKRSESQQTSTFFARDADGDEYLVQRAPKPPVRNNRPGVGSTYFKEAGTAAIGAVGDVVSGVGGIVSAFAPRDEEVFAFAARDLDGDELLVRRKGPKPAAKPPVRNNRPGIGSTYFNGAGTAAIGAVGDVVSGVGGIVSAFAPRSIEEEAFEELLLRRKNPKPSAKPPARPSNRPGIGQTYFSGAGTAAIGAVGGIMSGVGDIVQATSQPGKRDEIMDMLEARETEDLLEIYARDAAVEDLLQERALFADPEIYDY